MKYHQIAIIGMLLLAAVAGGAAVATAQESPPGEPASFYGTIEDGEGNPAPVGTTIYAVVIDENGDTSVEGSITVEEAGGYGGSEATADKLRVDSTAGQEVRFHVDSPEGPQSDTYDLESGVFDQPLTFSEASFTIDSLTLELGDTSLEVGDTTDATVTAEFDDGSTQDITDQATIESSDTGVATVNDATIEAQSLGSATIEASLRGQSDSVAVDVVEDASDDDDDGGSGGGGGGGGGGAGTGDGGLGVDTPDISDQLGDDAEISEETEVIITTNPETGASTATFGATSNVESISFSGEVEGTVVVRNIDGIPAATGSPPGTSVTISDITVPEGARDSPATIRKRVSNDRLSELGVEDQELAIYRFADGEWSQLDTGVASETDSGMILEAETPGFSFFAVSTVEDAPADDGGADDTATDDQESGGLNPTIIGLIGLVVLIAVGVGLYTRRE